MTENYVSYISLALSLVTTLVMLGISVGIFRSKLNTLEQSLSGMGKRFDDEFKTLKEEHLKAVTERIKENEHDTKKLAETVIRMEERIIAWQGAFDLKWEALGKQIEKLEAQV